MRHNACGAQRASRHLMRDVARPNGDDVQLPSHRIELLRMMIAPAILPDILTARKVNLGNASHESRSPRSINPPPGGCARFE
jgi:hypothetical protein